MSVVASRVSVESQAPAKSVISDCQCCFLLLPCCGLRDRCVYVRDSAVPSVGFLERKSSCRAAQVAASRFQAHSSTVESLSVELRDRVIPEPWPIPPVRTSLEMEAGSLGSGVQELLGAEELTGDGLSSGLQLQWAIQTEFPNVMRLFKTRLLRDSTHSSRFGGIFAVLASAVAGLDLGTQGCEVDVPLTGGPSGAAHPSDLRAAALTEIAAELESQLGIVSEVQGESVEFSPDGRYLEQVKRRDDTYCTENDEERR